MLAAALFAFLHHLAAFALVAAIGVEFVLLRGELTYHRARQLRVVDALYGASAGLLLAVGLLRVFFFEKGAAYYFHSAPFLAKLTLFLLVGVASIYPTLEFQSWKGALKAGRAPLVAEEKMRRLRRIVHWEAAGIVLIVLNAALMARGIGFFG